MKKYRHSKKSEIATVITLVLMVVGLVGTIFTAGMVNKNKIATNSRAATTSCNGTCKFYSCSNNETVYNQGVADCMSKYGSGSICCVSNTPTPTKTQTPQSSFTCNSGKPIIRGASGCYDTCSAQNMKYISNSQGKGADGNWYCCCEETPVSQGFDTCYKAYRHGMYGCGENENKVVVYARSMSAVGMTSCEAYNKGSTTALYFSGKPGQYEDGGCYDV